MTVPPFIHICIMSAALFILFCMVTAFLHPPLQNDSTPPPPSRSLFLGHEKLGVPIWLSVISKLFTLVLSVLASEHSADLSALTSYVTSLGRICMCHSLWSYSLLDVMFWLCGSSSSIDSDLIECFHTPQVHQEKWKSLVTTIIPNSGLHDDY